MRFLVVLIFCLLPALASAAKRVAVLELYGEGTEGAVLRLLSDNVRAGVLDAASSRLFQGEELLVMTRENMREMLQQQGQDPICKPGDCEVEAARNLGADFVVSGELVRTERSLILGLKLHGTQLGRLLAVEDVRAERLEDLMDRTRATTKELVLQGLPDLKPTQEHAVANHQNVEGGKSFFISSEPPGATVLLDGKMLCSRTPCKRNLAPKTYSLRLEKKQYISAEIPIDVGSSTSHHEALSPLFGVLSITSSPGGMQIRSGEESWGRTPLRAKTVDPGRFSLEASSHCHHTAALEVQVAQGQNQTAHFDMRPRQAELKVLAHQADQLVQGELLVDGIPVGETGEILKVNLCSNRVVLRFEDAQRWSSRLELVEGELLEIEAMLPGKSRMPMKSPLPPTPQPKKGRELAKAGAVGTGLVGAAALRLSYTLYQDFQKVDDPVTAHPIYKANRAAFWTGTALVGTSSILLTFSLVK
jgi:hypothetical protein